jgi:hypothetical protein
MERPMKLEKRHKKAKKRAEKRARDSLDSDIDSDQERVFGSTGNRDPADKRIKLVQPSGVQLKSTDTRPIKATKLALDTIRANEIAIESSKTGKVTAVVVILKIFGEKIQKSC